MIYKINNSIKKMNNIQFSIVTFSLIFGIICLFSFVLASTIASDLNNKVIKLEKENQELRWENSQTTIYCEVE